MVPLKRPERYKFWLTVNGVVGHQVDEIIDIHEWIVDSHNLGFACVLSES